MDITGCKRQMRHGNQFEISVVNAENLITLEIKAVNIPFYLLIRSGIAKPEIAIRRVQCEQMLDDALTLAGPYRSYRHSGGCDDRCTGDWHAKK